ncbi:CLUMA_CG000497, isoform A [Clunio marinus]|uniref:CLUMA_CG000497, isoform A n=1 Tax=Clunio marinus TaxID=568069 RepID=A0A1J1HF77_9DIPT|nr:CLUMA_CG000497, isoform A [Clunio marinus]
MRQILAQKQTSTQKLNPFVWLKSSIRSVFLLLALEGKFQCIESLAYKRQQLSKGLPFHRNKKGYSRNLQAFFQLKDYLLSQTRC